MHFGLVLYHVPGDEDLIMVSLDGAPHTAGAPIKCKAVFAIYTSNQGL